MFFPIRTDCELKRRPWVNYCLVAANVFVFVVLQRAGQAGDQAFMLTPADPAMYQYISYQFMHGGWMHIIGNMIALWVFGNGVEDRMGKGGYLMFYLTAGVLAGLGHAVTEVSPVLGASGAVAGVTGAYLALFPFSNVVVLVVFFFITFIELPSIVVVGVYIVWDIFSQFTGAGNVAYTAHLAGYLFGFVAGLGLLLGRILPHEPSDLLSIMEQKRRKQQFRSLTRGGANPWSSRGSGDPGRPPAQPPTAAEQALMQQRSRVTQALQQGDMPEAAEAYRQLVADHPDQLMSQQGQLDLANQLMSEGRYRDAAQAYELFLKHFPGYAHIQQVRLILGLIYARYLDEPARARELLAEAEGKLTDEERTLAREMMAELK
jgi:membrane associated rhomboid family serine protease